MDDDVNSELNENLFKLKTQKLGTFDRCLLLVSFSHSDIVKEVISKH